MIKILLTIFTSLILMLPLQAQEIVGKWKLSSIKVENGEPLEVEVPVTLNISSDNKIGGKGGCNSYGGSYSLVKPNQVNFTDIFSTRMFCEGTSKLEGDFFQSLQSAKTAKINKGKLFIQNKEKGISLIFVKSE